MKNSTKRIKLNSKEVQQRPLYFGIKRISDILLSTVGIILLSPVFLVISLCIKFDGTNGPIFYSQERIGKNGKPFKMYKFRSMIPDADQQLDKLSSLNEVEGAMFKIHDDPRITKVGKVIRKYSLDELPQLVNVIGGSMTLVGPRPALPAEVDQYSEYDKQRLLVKPGCTGLWQVTDRNNTDFDGEVYLDLKYIQKSTLVFDGEIILRTVKVMISPNAAY